MAGAYAATAVDGAALHLVHGGVGVLEHRLHVGTVLGVDRKSDAGR